MHVSEINVSFCDWKKKMTITFEEFLEEEIYRSGPGQSGSKIVAWFWLVVVVDCDFEFNCLGHFFWIEFCFNSFRQRGRETESGHLSSHFGGVGGGQSECWRWLVAGIASRRIILSFFLSFVFRYFLIGHGGGGGGDGEEAHGNGNTQKK